MELRMPFARVLSLYLSFAVFVLALPVSGWAMFLPGDADRTSDVVRIQTALEARVVAQRLTDLGLSADEAMARVRSLPDDELHRLAANLDTVAAGGDGVGAVIGLLLVAIVVVIVLQATGHEIILKK